MRSTPLPLVTTQAASCQPSQADEPIVGSAARPGDFHFGPCSNLSLPPKRSAKPKRYQELDRSLGGVPMRSSAAAAVEKAAQWVLLQAADSAVQPVTGKKRCGADLTGEQMVPTQVRLGSQASHTRDEYRPRNHACEGADAALPELPDGEDQPGERSGLRGAERWRRRSAWRRKKG